MFMQQEFVQREVKKDKFSMLSGRTHYSSEPANPHLFICIIVFFLFLHAQILIKSETFYEHSLLHHVPILIFV
jgi:hypothetical protein